MTTLPPTNPDAARDEAELYARASALFMGASELPLAEQRAFLESECDDDTIRHRVDAMLRAHAEEDGLLETLRFEVHGSSIAGAIDHAFNDDIPTPDAIGRYRILRAIGQGGMGVVYEAEQDEPRRRVALKILPHGMITPSMVKRFRLEAEVLGHLQHPGIAQIHDAGTITTDGVERPFFAMEYIEGQTLLDYAAAHELTVPQRLALLVRICDAVHHAHQKGIIHRDLKPGNILVLSEPDGTPLPKILDFGIARATDADLRSVTLQTNPGQIIGTVPYMSPEQAAGDTGIIDIRSDVYALGVVAYELLTGRLPYPVEDRIIHEAVRVIREDAPSRMSVIDRSLRGDIETIVRTALAKEQERRYQSAAELATDIRHYLADEPIAARPASAFYQVRKFAQRHQALVASAALIFLISIVGTIVATRYAFIANQNAEVIERREKAAVWQNYKSGIRAAVRFLEQGRFKDAEAALLDSPEEHRGWEWRHLMAQFPAHDMAWQGQPDGAPNPRIPPVVSRDGSRVYMFCRDGMLRTWNTDDGTIASSTALPTGTQLVAVDPDGLSAATTDGRGTIIITRLADPDADPLILADSGEPARTARPLCWSSDAQRLLLARDGELLTWNVSSNATDLATMPSSGLGHITRARFIDDDSRIVATIQGRPGFVILDAATMSVESTFDTLTDAITCFDYLPERGIIACGGQFRNVILVDVNTGALIQRLTGHRKGVHSVAFTDDGSSLVSASTDGAVRKWRVATGDELQILEVGQAAHAAFTLPGTDDIVLVGDHILQYSWRRGTARQLGTHLPYVYYIAFAPDGETVASTCHYAETVRIWSVQGDGLVSEYPAASGGWHIHGTPSIHYSIDGATLHTTTRDEIAAVNIGTDTLERTDITGMAESQIAALMGLDLQAVQLMHSSSLFPRANTAIRVRTNKGVAEVIRDGNVIATLEHANNETAIVPSPDGTRFAMTRSDGIVDIRDVDTLDVIRQFKGHAGGAYAAAFHPTEPRLATGDEGGIVRIWDLKSAELLLELHDHSQYIHDLSFSPDGSMLASASGDGTIRLWSTRSHAEHADR